eukprot:scaffold24305_cov84-Isochrysis_galbana.AAC.2
MYSDFFPRPLPAPAAHPHPVALPPVLSPHGGRRYVRTSGVRAARHERTARLARQHARVQPAAARHRRPDTGLRCSGPVPALGGKHERGGAQARHVPRRLALPHARHAPPRPALPFPAHAFGDAPIAAALCRRHVLLVFPAGGRPAAAAGRDQGAQRAALGARRAGVRADAPPAPRPGPRRGPRACGVGLVLLRVRRALLHRDAPAVRAEPRRGLGRRAAAVHPPGLLAARLVGSSALRRVREWAARAPGRRSPVQAQHRDAPPAGGAAAGRAGLPAPAGRRPRRRQARKCHG